MTDPVGVGVVGAGNISVQYLTHLTTFPDLAVRMVADLDAARARARAEEFGVPRAGSLDELLTDGTVELIVNLTVPAAHAEVGRRVVDSGRHLWNEKPITPDVTSALDLLQAADARGVRVGVAPDTVLGAGVQTALRAIADGAIGRPLSALTSMIGPGPDTWHPDPEFLFARGAGPLFDMGPYYLTTLVSVLGPVRRVAAAGSQARARRTIGSGPRAGTGFDVQVPTHTSLLLAFDDDASAQSTFSFQSSLKRAGVVEVTGTEGVLVLPDPNGFEGESLLWRTGDDGPSSVPARGAVAGRGLGVLELARAVRAGVPHRADGRLALHVLDVMQTALALPPAGSAAITTEAMRPEPLPVDWDPFTRSAAA